MMGKRIVIGNTTDKGMVRTNNQDYFASYEGRFGTLVIVCDGMGGHEGGEIASRMAAEVIRDHFLSLEGTFDIRTELRRALIAASRTILDRASVDPALHDMGTTAVILILQGDLGYVAHVGDSRIYLIRDARAIPLTKDHSLVQRMIDAKMLSEEEGRDHPKKNVIEQALGAGKTKIDPTVSDPFPIFRNDRFLLCTDGLTSHVTDQELGSLGGGKSAQSFSDLLVNLTNKRGGEDNITVQIVDVRKGKKRPIESAIRKQMPRYAAIAAGIGTAALCIGYIAGRAGIFDSAPHSDPNPPPDSLHMAVTSNRNHRPDSLGGTSNQSPSDSAATKASGGKVDQTPSIDTTKNRVAPAKSTLDTKPQKKDKGNGSAH